ncbi:hypothetical protein H310_06813 [Aphanomyces invadans]|uniref:phosphatidylinositol-3,4-bisphosphate 4-phosphatase n=1 Tax=Aphanomyces invadans TaxID=157072 RepID=A0A024U4R0_9STRA|nr:hypothetical protein H310_06813 [Aphanomyces invadans]ETW01225.1 hypothetical protein H310_06813 [Aphanomyces invadans]|eukprot:XP_008870223.1 hypothetical protein H310_06813 [Aphanomyces invadans]
MMATGELEPVIQAKRPSANTVAPPAEELTVLPSPPVHPKVNDDDEPPSPVAAPRPVLDAATLSYRSTRKELISVFVACTNLNLPQLPQTFFQSIFKGKTPDSNLPEIRVEVDIKPTSDANKSSSVFHNTTEALRVRNPSFSMGLTIPVPISKANSEEYHLYFRVVQTDVGMEKTVATTEMMCGVLLESFKQGSPVVHLPLLTNASHEAILSLTLARVFPIKHNVLPTQNMLMHMYSFDEPKRKDPSSHLVAEKTPLLASEELVEVGYVTSLPPIFLQQCTDEMVAAHRLWSVRYANARKSALLFESPDEALANGCDVYAVEVISGKGLTLPAELNLQPAPAAPVTPTHRTISANSSSGTRSRSSSNASKESTKQPVVTCNPFVAVKFKETTKGKRPVEVTEGRTSVEKNTSEPHWGENNSTVGGKAQTNGIQFYRPNEGQPAHSLRRTLEFDVLSQCDAHFDGEIALGHVTLPIDAVMYEGKSAVWDINLTRWLPVITPTGEERGEILIRLQMRRTTTVFSLDKEPAFAPGSLFRLADPKRHAKWQSTLEASNYNPSSLSISEIRDLVASHESAIAQLRTWQHHVETTSTEWFRSSELKAKLEVQPLTTNLHVSYFRLYAGQAPARATVLEGRPRDVEIGLLPGDELSASTRNMLGRGGGGGGSRFSLEDLVDHDSPLQVNATYATVTCGAPTAHGLGLSQFGLVELEDRLLSVDMPIESYQCTYAVRKAVCMSQALSVLVAAFSTQLELVLQKSVPNHEWLLEQWIQVGFLLGWESLVSTQGKELHMLSDAWVAIKSMERIQIQLVPHCELMTFAPSPDTDNKYILQLPVPSSVFGLLPQVLQDGGLIAVTSVLFTQGINEMQTLANVVGAVGIALQVRINDKCCAALAKYHEKLMAVPSLQGMTAQMKDIKLDALTTLIANSNESTMTKKNHRILLEASDTIRRLNGGRVTFCKSGKDRTAMSVTLDQARVIGSTWKHVPMMIQEGTSKQDWAVLKPVANLMREFGVRIEVAKKNVGHPRYSFNGLQRKMLPKIYRPPRGAIIKGDHDVDDS